MAKVPNAVKNIAENLKRLSRAHERYRQTTDDRRQTDGRAIAYSEREREFTFVKNWTGQPAFRYRQSAVLRVIFYFIFLK